MLEVWSLDQIKELDFASPTGFMKVRDFLPEVLAEVGMDVTGQYKILRSSMTQFGQTIPVRISSDCHRLRDGIHRIAIATGLGWETMYVSTERYENDWDNTEEGQEYWRLWNNRLKGLGYGKD